MKRPGSPQDEVFWYLNRGPVAPCEQDLTVDVVVIGGGMAGLHAAQAFSKKGKKVALLEQYYCGSGATGKSSGFITPNAELSFTDFSKRYNQETARNIWNLFISGVEDIRSNIIHNSLACDYMPQNTLVVANSKHDLKGLAFEHDNLIKAGYSSAFYTGDNLKDHIGSTGYVGGVGYQDTFGVQPYLYCQEMKNVLRGQNVLVFEETPVTSIDGHTVITARAKITAEHIVVCTDRFLPELTDLKQEVYNAQTFVMASQQLTDAQLRAIFPADKLLVWDTELIYNYFRVTGDNRLILGGGSVLNTYASKAQHESAWMLRKLTNYFNKKFPGLNITFEQMWPGLIGLSKDIAPLAGRDKNKPYLYYISAVAGLPIAAALGRYSAENLLDGRTDLDPYFSPYRSYIISGLLQTLLGTKLTFALSNFIAAKL